MTTLDVKIAEEGLRQLQKDSPEAPTQIVDERLSVEDFENDIHASRRYWTGRKGMAERHLKYATQEYMKIYRDKNNDRSLKSYWATERIKAKNEIERCDNEIHAIFTKHSKASKLGIARRKARLAQEVKNGKKH